MKIVFDTNVLISGFLTTSGPAQHVLNRALKGHEVILSDYILEEFQNKLTRKLGFPGELIEQAVHFLKLRATIVAVPRGIKIEFSDRKDVPILTLIQIAKPHYFVTGDKRLLSLKKLGPTLFLSPREAMEMI